MPASWRPQQRDVLHTMGIPAYQLKPSSGAECANDAAAATHYRYRLGVFYMTAAQPLPVELPRWLEDFCVLLDSRPVAVKDTAESAMVLDYQQCQKQMSTPAGKRQFWYQIRQQLTQP